MAFQNPLGFRARWSATTRPLLKSGSIGERLRMRRKLFIIRAALTRGKKSLSEVAREHDLSVSTVKKWLKEYRCIFG